MFANEELTSARGTLFIRTYSQVDQYDIRYFSFEKLDKCTLQESSIFLALISLYIHNLIKNNLLLYFYKNIICETDNYFHFFFRTKNFTSWRDEGRFLFNLIAGNIVKGQVEIARDCTLDSLIKTV